MIDKKNVRRIVIILITAKLLAVVLLAYFIPYAQDYIKVNPDSLDEYSHMYYRLEDEDNSLFRALCCRWDSGHYLDIALNGYHNDMLYAFSPLYPLLIRITSRGLLATRLSEIMISNRLAGILISNIFSIISAIIFYKTARIYMSDRESYKATLFFSLFPTVFAYGTVAYTEPMFLAFSIGSWYLFETKRYLRSGILMMLASLTRYPGILLFPIAGFALLYKTRKNLTRKSLGDFVRLGLPALVVLAWIIIMSFAIDVSYSSIQRTYWDNAIGYPLAFIGFIKLTTDSVVRDPTFYFIFFALAGIACYRIRPYLSGYVIFMVIIYSTFMGTAAAALPRYLATIWPAFLPLGIYIRKDFYIVTFLVYSWVFSMMILLSHSLWIFYA